MPYIITTSTPPTGTPRERTAYTMWGTVTRTAVATLDEARMAVASIYDGFTYTDVETAMDNCWEAENLPEAGKTIGPLPDGTVIEVARADWMDFERMVVPGPVAAAVPITTFDDDDYRDALIRAYNAR